MSQPQTHRPRLRRPLVALAATAALILVGVFGSLASAQTSKRVVDKAHNASLGKTVLTNRAGLTLYSLSAETHGRFICKGSCLHDWHPLVVAKGVKPTGPVSLGTIKRPDNGMRQVTFAGKPLYTFDEDRRKGDADGEGFKDVGTWHAATP